MQGEGEGYLVICWALLSLLVPFRGTWEGKEGSLTALLVVPPEGLLSQCEDAARAPWWGHELGTLFLQGKPTLVTPP